MFSIEGVNESHVRHFVGEYTGLISLGLSLIPGVNNNTSDAVLQMFLYVFYVKYHKKVKTCHVMRDA